MNKFNIKYFILAVLITYTQMSFAITTGEKAPDLSEPSSVRIELDKYKSKVIYLDFWASWCAVCQLSLPWMNEMAQKYKDQNFQVIAVSLDKDRSVIEELIESVKPIYPIVLDSEGKLALLYKISSMPASYLIGSDGKIISSYNGFSDKHKNTIEADIKKALEKKVP